jgi:hypothetical protein
MHPATKPLSWKSATVSEALTEEQAEILQGLREQWEQERKQEAEEEEEEEEEEDGSRPRLHPVFPPVENAEFSVCGIRVRATSRGWVVLEP